MLLKDKLRLLLSAICTYLETLNGDILQNALRKSNETRRSCLQFIIYSGEICDISTMNSDARTDLERSFYFFIKAVSLHFRPFNNCKLYKKKKKGRKLIHLFQLSHTK
jgi:hypothetical protein